MKLPKTGIPVVLLIEDEYGDAELIRWHLLEKNDEAFEVYPADSLAAAKRLMEDEGLQPDVVLLDLNLPDSSGTQTVERCRLLTDAPIVVLTGHDDLAATQAAIESGAEDFLSKGGDAASLRRALRYAMLRYRRDADARLAATVFSHAQEGVMVADRAGNLIEVNQAFTQMTGYSRDEVIGRNPRFLKSGQQSAEFYQQLWRDLLANGHWSGEVANLRKNGDLFIELLTISVVYDGGGRLRHFVAMCSDITARKDNEALLVRARSEAEAANVAKSRFLATMSHEIRTPMNGILGMAQLLLMPDLRESARNDYARTILSSGQTLLTLLNDILDLSKIEAGKLQLESTVFAPDSLLHEISKLFAGAAQAKGLQLGCQWQGRSGQRYQADSHRLRQMLSNLLGNAIKFTSQGCIDIVGSEIESDGEVALLEFAVSDTGIGVPADKLDLLFRPFSQTDNSITREFGGSGLGLSIVRNLATLMGGEVGVDSEPGKGSRFWFRVAARKLAEDLNSRQTKRESHAPNIAHATTLFKGHVLVVEDNLVNCMVIESLLAGLGMTVSVVHDGQQAVAMVKQTDLAALPHLVLMDLQMPVMDGYEATQDIRQWEASNPKHPRIPIIALTADAFDEDRQHCQAVDMDDFLTKPIALEALQDALAKWLPAVPQTPARVAVEYRPLDPQAFAALVGELTPLLEDNKFSAFACFKSLQSLVEGTHLAEQINALVGELQEMRFANVLGRLRQIDPHMATQPEAMS